MIFNAATNNTSKEVEELFTNIKTEISALIAGLSTDVSTLKSNISTLTTNVSTVKTDVSTVKSNVSTLSTTVNSIPKGAVKSVQRGVIPAGRSVTTYEELSVLSGQPRAYYIDVTINAVSNINKCFVYANVATDGSVGIPKLLNATTLRLYINGGNGDYTSYLNFSAISWQVVEFY